MQLPAWSDVWKLNNKHNAGLMFKVLTEHWEQFRHYRPGERFERYYCSRHESSRSATKKALLIGLGALIMAIGVVFLAIPGPGLLVMLVGAGLIARESLYVSRLFDRIEPNAWKLARWLKRNWQSLSLGSKIVLFAIAAILGLLALYIAYTIFFK
jgi:hypothetical protein